MRAKNRVSVQTCQKSHEKMFKPKNSNFIWQAPFYFGSGSTTTSSTRISTRFLTLCRWISHSCWWVFHLLVACQQEFLSSSFNSIKDLLVFGWLNQKTILLSNVKHFVGLVSKFYGVLRSGKVYHDFEFDFLLNLKYWCECSKNLSNGLIIAWIFRDIAVKVKQSWARRIGFTTFIPAL